jgi:hypothetical protein
MTGKKKIQYLVTILCFILPIVILSTVFNSGNNHLEPLYKMKLKEFSRLKDEIDVIFVGTSTTWRNIATRKFDRELNKCGLNYVSYNFGIPMMRYGEVLFLLEEIRRLNPKKLKFIILETFVNEKSHVGQLKDTRKFVFWHDLSNTLTAINTEWNREDLKGKTARKIYRIYHHIRAFYLNTVSKGNGFYSLNYYFKYPGEQTRMFSRYNRKVKYGNLGLEKDISPRATRRKNFLRNTAFFEKRVKTLRGRPSRKMNAYKRNRRPFYDRIMRWSKTMRVHLIFFTAPVNHSRTYRVIDSKGKRYPVLRLNDAEKYESLYRPDRWFDFTHLNSLGAGEASGYLAHLFCRLLENKKLKNKSRLNGKVNIKELDH